MKNSQIMYFLIVILFSLLISYDAIGEYIWDSSFVQDDFRQSASWLWQFWDSSLLQGDFFVDIYKSFIYRSPLYWVIFKLGPYITPDMIFYSKLLAIITAVLSSISGYLFFRSFVARFKFFSNPHLLYSAATIFSVFISVLNWCTDHVSASFMRAPIWFGILMSLYFLIERRYISYFIFATLLLLSSPVTFLLSFALFFVHGFFEATIFSIKSLILRLWLALGVMTGFLYFYVFRDLPTQGIGRRFTVPEMKSMPEFNPGGRHPIFGSNIWDGSWWKNEHWGFGYGYLEISKVVFVALFLLFVTTIFIFLNKKITKSFFSSLLKSELFQLFSSSVALYLAAQITFPLIYLPSRYISTPMILLSIILIAFLPCYILKNFFEHLKIDIKNNKYIYLIILLITCLIFGAYFRMYYHTRFVSVNKKVIEIVSSLPKDSLIAGLPILPDVNSLSITAKRKVYIDYERSMTYGEQSQNEIRRRNLVAIKMTYATTKEEFLALAQQEGITHFLALRDLYNYRNLQNARYINPYNQFLKQTIFQAKGQFFLAQYLDQIKQNYVLIDIASLVNSAS